MMALQPQPQQATSLGPIEGAARQVESQIYRDNGFPDLQNLLGSQSHVSGDYSPCNLGRPILRKEAVIPLPQYLAGLYSQKLEYKTFMGIFPEIGRVWMTIDNNLYLWDYITGSICEHSCGQIIVGVTLAKPAGSWGSSPPAWVLVVATVTQVLLLSLNFSDGEMKIKDAEKAASVDGVGMMCMAATSDGRVFLGGYDGNLYRLSYAENGILGLGYFFSSCRLSNVDMGTGGAVIKQFSPALASWLYKGSSIIKIAVDNERGILYTLTQSSIIKVYDIGGVTDCVLITTFEVNKHIQQFMQISNNVTVTNIIVVTEKESKSIHLLAVTDDATRLYFSTSDLSFHSPSDARVPPKGLNLIHAKRPGTYPHQAGSGPVTVASYHQGVFAYADPRTVGKDVVVANALDYSVIHANLRFGTNLQNTGAFGGAPQASSFSLAESSCPFSAEVTVLAMAPLPQPPQASLTLSPLNLLVRQHLTPAPQLICVSSLGLFTMSYIRPLDELNMILASNMDPTDFFNRYKPPQACAMALHIAILGQPVLQEIAKNVFMANSGQPKFMTGNPPAVAAQPTPHMGTTLGNPTFTNSPGYEGTVMLIAAFFNSFWSRSICVEVKYNPTIHGHRYPLLPALIQAGVVKETKPPEMVLVSRFDPQVLEDMSRFLVALQAFFKRNNQWVPQEAPLAPIIPNNPLVIRQPIPQPNAQQNDVTARYREQVELYELSLFVSRSVHAINFLIIVANFFPQLSSEFSSEMRNFLTTSQLRELICTPNGLNNAQLIMEHLTKYASNRGMDVSNLMQSVLQSCPSFFSPLEKTKATADALVNNAFGTDRGLGFEPSAHALEYLQPALRLYLSIVPKFDLADIPDKFISLAFYPGVLELCFKYADALDPANRATKYYNDKKQHPDGERLYNERKSCYAHIIKVFDALKTNTDLSGEEQLRREYMAADVKNMIFHHAINSKDELFHYELYAWYFKRGKGQEVVLMDTPFVEKFLEQHHRDALAQYYIRLHRFIEAASVLAELAELPDMPIEDRVGNLSRAVSAINASAEVDTEFAKELQDKLDVALVQFKIYDLGQSNQHLREMLTTNLFDLGQLFNLAGENNLKEGQLLVLSAANHKDEQRVRYLWGEIVSEAWESTNHDIRAVVAKILSLIASMATKTTDYIPLGDLLDSLERYSVDSVIGQEDPAIVFKLLAGSSPVMEPLNLFLEYYDLLKRSNWTDPRGKTHIYIILTTLLESWHRHIQFSGLSQERNPAFAALGLDTKIDDIISGLGMLSANPRTADCREKLQRLRGSIFPPRR